MMIMIIWCYVGVDTGINIRVQGQGAEGRKGAPSGNLYVMLEVGVEFVCPLNICP